LELGCNGVLELGTKGVLELGTKGVLELDIISGECLETCVTIGTVRGGIVDTLFLIKRRLTNLS
jgi:hypothetical protein